MIDNLTDCILIDIGRVLNLVWIIFIKNNIEYSFHIQCPWRIIINNKIIITDISLFEDENNECIFDKEISIIKEQLINRSVKQVYISDQYDVNILLDDESHIEVFVNDDRECWRFFEKGKIEKEHLVVYANKMELE